MQLGIHLPQYGRAAAPEAMRDVAIRAEELGFADVWVSDHLIKPTAQEYPSAFLYDPIVSLTWAAAVTSRIGLGTSVLVVPQYHPLALANSLASLDNLSGGRLTVAAGVGWSEAEFEALGQDFATRGARMDEAVEILRTVWSHDPATYEGRHYAFSDIRVQPQPVGPIPIWFGGTSAPARRRTAATGDGWQGISTPPDQIAEMVAGLHADRPAGAAPLTISYRTGWDPQGMDPDVIAAEAAAYEAAGVDHVVAAPWRSTAAEWIRSMELLVEIVPVGT